MNEYPTIRGNTDLRMAYSFLSLALETALPIDFTVAVKRAIRKYTHRQTDYGIRAIWSDGEKLCLPCGPAGDHRQQGGGQKLLRGC